MSHFIGNGILEFLPDGRQARVITYLIFVDSRGVSYSADPGQIVDGASIPRFFWRLMGSPFVGRHRRAALVHDGEYIKRKYTRLEVDRMFLEALKVDGVGLIKRQTMYRIVRAFGKSYWDSDEPKRPSLSTHSECYQRCSVCYEAP